MQKLAENATSINDLITKLYFPAGLYINLITNFNIKDLLILIFSNIGIFAISIFILSKFYFKINSGVKSVKVGKKNKNYKISESKPLKALIKKELNRFITSPVFVTNAAFGLVIFIIGCIAFTFKYDTLSVTLAKQFEMPLDKFNNYIPLVLFGFIIFSSLMTSITSSMISLEGKTFNILKSLPVKAYTIINAKILTAVLVMIPCFLIGDIIIFTKFTFNILEIVMIILASIVLPLVAETYGIIINLKYPNMKASNDTEVVKQSTSSMVSVFVGLILVGISLFGIVTFANTNIDLVMGITLLVYIVIYIALHIYLNKNGSKLFNEIIV
jgi:ABC-2 type transport system permease protein